MRTFHIGGTASRRVEQATLEAKTKGKIRLNNVQTVTNVEGAKIVMNRRGEIQILDSEGRERESYPLVYGAILKIQDGEEVKLGQLMAEWDPYSTPILAEVSGTIQFEDVVDGVTMQERFDSVTGLAHRTIIESKTDKRPKILIADDSGNPIEIEGSSRKAMYLLPGGANISLAQGDKVHAGDVVAKIQRESSKTTDITGGLPRVAELFEARRPKDAAEIADIDGVISFGKDTKGKRKLIITPEGEDAGEPVEKLIARGRHLTVNEGDFIRKGDPLMDGAIDPHDILRVKGRAELAKYLVDQIQEVYRLQGVKINDKHVESIVRQMLRKVKVIRQGDTATISNEIIDQVELEEINAAMAAEGGEVATFDPILLGITKASLSTKSFISASSFQETTKVLTEASLFGKTDDLVGLKENVIMGRLIPAGTGLAKYKDYEMEVDEMEELDDEDLEEDIEGIQHPAMMQSSSTSTSGS